MNATIQDYRNFCESRSSCKNCPLLNDYPHCMGFIADNPEAADKVIQQWLNVPTVYIVVDKYESGESAVKGVARTREEADKILDNLCSESLIDCLSEKPEESGVFWSEMSEQAQKDFYEKEIKASFAVIEMKEC